MLDLLLAFTFHAKHSLYTVIHSAMYICHIVQVKTELPLTAMTTSGKVQAERAIEGVKERGHTNLSGGLLAALEALYR